jgi:hypothetical protein
MRIENAPDEKPPGFPRILPDGGQRRGAEPAQEHVVVTDDRHIARDNSADTAEGADGAQGN